jgi:hypothetical protein
MPVRLAAIVLPGPELEVKPLEDRREPFVLRIAEVYPHGSARRYVFVYYALEPGSYDLTKYLRRKDGSALGKLASIPVKVDPVLPPGQIEPHALSLAPAPRLGGYRWLLALAGSLWCAGLAAILLLGRRRRMQIDDATSRPLTLADRLSPLVTSAVEGTLSGGQHAELERLLIGYWRRRLKLEQASPAQAMSAMRNHPEAGPLLRQLEEWLHRPGSRADAIDLASLLRPYQSMPAETQEPDTSHDGSNLSPAAVGGRSR